MNMAIGRNDECWCKSGLKYKKCHAAIDQRAAAFARRGCLVPKRNMLKNQAQVDGIRESGKINTALLDYIGDFVKDGVDTETLDQLIYNRTVELGGIPAPLDYNGFPKSCCISIDSVVCHGIPSKDTVLRDGDIVNIDISTIYNGYFSDSSRMFCVGGVSAEKKRLVDAARECMEAGMALVRPWGFLGDVGHAVSRCARENGYTVVQEIGGHGVGLQFHEDPWVGYVTEAGTGMLLVPGMVFTVEPMINMGEADVIFPEGDEWTIYTADGKPSAQWETTVLVTDSGYEVLAH